MRARRASSACVAPRASRSWRRLAAKRSGKSSIASIVTAFCQCIGVDDNEMSAGPQITFEGFHFRRRIRMNLENTNVLITGSSRGLGRALFERFARAGAGVVGVARDV